MQSLCVAGFIEYVLIKFIIISVIEIILVITKIVMVPMIAVTLRD